MNYVASVCFFRLSASTLANEWNVTATRRDANHSSILGHAEATTNEFASGCPRSASEVKRLSSVVMKSSLAHAATKGSRARCIVRISIQVEHCSSTSSKYCFCAVSILGKSAMMIFFVDLQSLTDQVEFNQSLTSEFNPLLLGSQYRRLNSV